MSAETMQIFVKTLDGDSIALDVKPTDTIRDVKGQIQYSKGMKIDDQRLISAGKQLDNDATLENHGITNGSTLHLVVRLKGGM